MKYQVVAVAALILLAGCSTTATTSTPTATPHPTPTATPTPLPDRIDVTFTLTCRTGGCHEFAEGPTYLEVEQAVQNDSGAWDWAAVYYGPIDDTATVNLHTDARYRIVVHGNEDSFAWRTDGTRVLGTLQPRQREYQLVVANCCSDDFSGS